MLFAPIGLLAVGLVAGALWWRWASRRQSIPCPTWLGWLLTNPYTNAVAGAGVILDRLRLALGMRVLDVGSGTGRVAIPAAERVGPTGEVVALDVQAGMLERVRSAATARGLTNVRTIEARIDGVLPANGSFDSAFDRALLVTVLGEIPDQARALRALYAALRHDGVLSITEMLPDPHYQSRRAVRRLAEDAGFQVEATHGTWIAYTMNFHKRLPDRPARFAVTSPTSAESP